MKLSLLLLALLLPPFTAKAQEPQWLSEQLITNEIRAQLQGQNQILPLRRELRLNDGTRVNDIIITAATAAGRGRMEVILNQQVIQTLQVDRKLRAHTVVINAPMYGNSILQLRTDGNFFIASVAATIERQGNAPGPQPQPGPHPGPYPGPQPVPPPVPNPIPVDTHRVCSDFTFAEYQLDGHNGYNSLNMARNYCDTNHGLFVDKRIFDKIYAAYRADSHNRYNSLNFTANFLRTNYELLRMREYSFDWLFSAYRQDGHNNYNSLNFAKTGLDNIPEQRMSCVQRTVEIYRRDGHNFYNAINLANNYCAR